MTEFGGILEIEIESLVASYPSEIKVDNHQFTLSTKIGNVIFEMNKGIKYPNNPPNITLQLYKQYKKDINSIKKLILDCFIKDEMSLILMVGAALDIANEMNVNDTNMTNQVDTTIKSSNNLMRVLIYFHHIMSSKKKATIKSKAIEFNLGGVYCTGFPGIIVCEGDQRDILDYISCLQNLRWQKMVVKGEMIIREEDPNLDKEEMRVFDIKGGLALVDDMSAIASICDEKGQKELFMTVYR